MAPRFDAASDRLLRTANVPSYDSDYSLLFWFYLTSGTLNNGVYSTLFSINNNNILGPLDHIDLVGIADNTPRLDVFTQTNVGDVSETVGTTTFNANTWYCVGFTRSGDASRIAHLGTLSTSLAQECNHTTSQSGRTTPSRMEFGGALSTNVDPFSTPGGRIGLIKIWTTARTLTELKQEQYVIKPIYLDNLHIWSPTGPVSERSRDYSSNGYNWTESGALTDEDSPPIPWGNSGKIFFIPAQVAANTIIPNGGIYEGDCGTPTIATVTPALEQEGFRWRNDNGSESTATWAAVQDSNISIAASTNIRLRFLINATGNPSTTPYQLEYRKQGETTWKKVLNAS